VERATRILVAQLLIIRGAAHISTVDAPEEIHEALENLWQR
jgi:pimeloyl-ACP methyl ester carboxylesterase